MKLTKLITRSSFVLLAAFSASTFAGLGLVKPDYTIHKADVNFKLSAGIAGDIEKETVKTKDMIDLLGGDSDNKDHELALAVPCDVDVEDPEVVAMYVANKETGLPVLLALLPDNIIYFKFVTQAADLKDGDLKKLDIVAESLNLPLDIGDFEFQEMIMSGTAKYGKLGKKLAEGIVGVSQDAVCAKSFKSKSVVGGIVGVDANPFYIGDINLMSGKVSAGNAKEIVDCNAFDFGDLCPAAE